MPSPEMQAVIDELRLRKQARAGQAPPTVDDLRAGFAPAGRPPEAIPDDVTVTAVDAGGVPAHWLSAPGADAGRTLLFLHGGGFSLGSLRSHGELAARLGRATGMRVLFPEYRLVPEHPFPAGVEDVRAVWHWLRAQGVPAGSVALAGDSAGGALGLTLLLSLRDAAEDLPAAAVVLSPAIDLTTSGASMAERADEDPIFTPGMIRGIAAGYLGEADPRAPQASPLFGDFTGLPPLLVQAGTAEVLLSDSERLAETAAAAGVDVTLTIGEGLPHVYPIMAGTPEAAEATREIAAFLGKHVR
ncbi:alpha/beta hydrolase [Amycolatopsis sp. NBC_01307]|uniref:alpha/beta hydrolase n=1 Tax=Amycolatopsis sp. NBC_01307 TaxID=2903561 RepID=UPI002E110FE7|nr:alpha/beta hydrolase [Amycolatopsis sp. NBC_01307]